MKRRIKTNQRVRMLVECGRFPTGTEADVRHVLSFHHSLIKAKGQRKYLHVSNAALEVIP